MRKGRGRAALSAGALALALGIPAAPAAAASSSSPGCDKIGGGLISGLAGSLCGLTDGVTDLVDGLTGGKLSPMTDLVDRTGEKILRKPTGEPSTPAVLVPSPTPATPTTTPEVHDLLPETLGPTCPPTAANCETVPSRQPKPDQTRRKASERDETERLPVGPPRPSPTPRPTDHRPETTENVQRVKSEPVDPESPRVDLLWPYLDRMPRPMQGRKAVVKPARPSDALGTALTAALLLSAILAARVVYARRAGDEHDETIPFEPLRVRGRQRLAEP
ncbi:hypothetical protein [Streptosporangium sp. KLBMP 9127]|nr:hypothetical protein [Streptosporangium sp. KLBMP 9127]